MSSPPSRLHSAVPDWNAAGVIPPVRPGHAGHDTERSPYRVTFADVVRQYGRSETRRKILRGLVGYRKALRTLGFDVGFQWLNGSFFENVEETRDRPPGDIDVVTFVALGDEAEQQARHAEAPDLFDHAYVKRLFHVDHYFVGLGNPMGQLEVKQVSYWYSMWSHRREDQLWKGFVEVALGSAEDGAALVELTDTDDARSDS